jgi:hypothetical protein
MYWKGKNALIMLLLYIYSYFIIYAEDEHYIKMLF